MPQSNYKNPRTSLGRVWRYQRGNQNPYIEQEQITQWLKEKVHKDKQRSTKHTYKTKDRVTRTPLKTAGELRCSGRSCFTIDTRCVPLVTNIVVLPSYQDLSFEYVKIVKYVFLTWSKLNIISSSRLTDSILLALVSLWQRSGQLAYITPKFEYCWNIQV